MKKPIADPKPCPNCQHYQELAKAFEARAEEIARDLMMANLALRLKHLEARPERTQA